MEKADIPIVCNLDAIESGGRATYIDAWTLLRASCLGFSEEGDAVVLRYPVRAEVLSAAAEWVDVERQCCAFFNFDLSLAAGASEFTVRLDGGPGVKEFLLAHVGPTIS